MKMDSRLFFLFLSLILSVNRTRALIEVPKTNFNNSEVLAKILQLFNEANSDERLFDVTFKLLTSLCVCVRETKSRDKSLTSDNNRLLEDKLQHVSIYDEIYNRTCLGLNTKIRNKINELHNVIGLSQLEKSLHRDMQDILKGMLSNHKTNDNDMDILHTILVEARRASYYIRKYRVLKPSSLSKDKLQDSIIIITLNPYMSKNFSQSNITTITDVEINNALMANTPVDIDVIDLIFERLSNKLKKAESVPHCVLKSIYVFLLDRWKNNKIKVFKRLRVKNTIKLYIHFVVENHHDDYTIICCNNSVPAACKPSYLETGIIGNVQNNSKNLHDHFNEHPEQTYKETISKIKNLFKIYDIEEKNDYYKNNELLTDDKIVDNVTKDTDCSKNLSLCIKTFINDNSYGKFNGTSQGHENTTLKSQKQKHYSIVKFDDGHTNTKLLSQKGKSTANMFNTSTKDNKNYTRVIDGISHEFETENNTNHTYANIILFTKTPKYSVDYNYSLTSLPNHYKELTPLNNEASVSYKDNNINEKLHLTNYSNISGKINKVKGKPTYNILVESIDNQSRLNNFTDHLNVTKQINLHLPFSIHDKLLKNMTADLDNINSVNSISNEEISLNPLHYTLPKVSGLYTMTAKQIDSIYKHNESNVTYNFSLIPKQRKKITILKEAKIHSANATNSITFTRIPNNYVTIPIKPYNRLRKIKKEELKAVTSATKLINNIGNLSIHGKETSTCCTKEFIALNDQNVYINTLKNTTVRVAEFIDTFNTIEKPLHNLKPTSDQQETQIPDDLTHTNIFFGSLEKPVTQESFHSGFNIKNKFTIKTGDYILHPSIINSTPKIQTKTPKVAMSHPVDSRTTAFSSSVPNKIIKTSQVENTILNSRLSTKNDKYNQNATPTSIKYSDILNVSISLLHKTNSFPEISSSTQRDLYLGVETLKNRTNNVFTTSKDFNEAGTFDDTPKYPVQRVTTNNYVLSSSLPIRNIKQTNLSDNYLGLHDNEVITPKDIPPSNPDDYHENEAIHSLIHFVSTDPNLVINKQNTSHLFMNDSIPVIFNNYSKGRDINYTANARNIPINPSLNEITGAQSEQNVNETNPSESNTHLPVLHKDGVHTIKAFTTNKKYTVTREQENNSELPTQSYLNMLLATENHSNVIYESKFPMRSSRHIDLLKDITNNMPHSTVRLEHIPKAERQTLVGQIASKNYKLTYSSENRGTTNKIQNKSMEKNSSSQKSNNVFKNDKLILEQINHQTLNRGNVASNLNPNEINKNRLTTQLSTKQINKYNFKINRNSTLITMNTNLDKRFDRLNTIRPYAFFTVKNNEDYNDTFEMITQKNRKPVSDKTVQNDNNDFSVKSSVISITPRIMYSSNHYPAKIYSTAKPIALTNEAITQSLKHYENSCIPGITTTRLKYLRENKSENQKQLTYARASVNTTPLLKLYINNKDSKQPKETTRSITNDDTENITVTFDDKNIFTESGNRNFSIPTFYKLNSTNHYLVRHTGSTAAVNRLLTETIPMYKGTDRSIQIFSSTISTTNKSLKSFHPLPSKSGQQYANLAQSRIKIQKNKSHSDFFTKMNSFHTFNEVKKYTHNKKAVTKRIINVTTKIATHADNDNVGDNNNFISTTSQSIYSSNHFPPQNVEVFPKMQEQDNSFQVISGLTSETTESFTDFLYSDLYPNSTLQNTHLFKNTSNEQINLDKSVFTDNAMPSQIHLAVTRDIKQKKVEIKDKIKNNTGAVISATNTINTNRVSVNSTLSSNSILTINPSNHYSLQITDSTTSKAFSKFSKERPFDIENLTTPRTTESLNSLLNSELVSKSLRQYIHSSENRTGYQDRLNKTILINIKMPSHTYMAATSDIKQNKAEFEGSLNQNAEIVTNKITYINIIRDGGKDSFASTTEQNFNSSYHYQPQNINSTETHKAINNRIGNEKSIKIKSNTISGTTEPMKSFLYLDLATTSPSQNINLSKNIFNQHFNKSVFIENVASLLRSTPATDSTKYIHFERISDNSRSIHEPLLNYDSTDISSRLTSKRSTNFRGNEKSIEIESVTTSGPTKSDLVSKPPPMYTHWFENTIDYQDYFKMSPFKNTMKPSQKHLSWAKDTKQKKMKMKWKRNKNEEGAPNSTNHMTINGVSDNSSFALNTKLNFNFSNHHLPHNTVSRDTLGMVTTKPISNLKTTGRSFEIKSLTTSKTSESLKSSLQSDSVAKSLPQNTLLLKKPTGYQDHLSKSVFINITTPSQRYLAVTKDIKQKKAEIESQNDKNAKSATTATNYINIYDVGVTSGYVTTSSPILYSSIHYPLQNINPTVTMSNLTSIAISNIIKNEESIEIESNTTSGTTEPLKSFLYSVLFSKSIPRSTRSFENPTNSEDYYTKSIFVATIMPSEKKISITKDIKQKKVEAEDKITTNIETTINAPSYLNTNNFSNNSSFSSYIVQSPQENLDSTTSKGISNIRGKERSIEPKITTLETTETLKSFHRIDLVSKPLLENTHSSESTTGNQDHLNEPVFINTVMPSQRYLAVTKDKKLKKALIESKKSKNKDQAKNVTDHLNINRASDNNNSGSHTTQNVNLSIHYPPQDINSTDTLRVLTNIVITKFKRNNRSIEIKPVTTSGTTKSLQIDEKFLSNLLSKYDFQNKSVSKYQNHFNQSDFINTTMTSQSYIAATKDIKHKKVKIEGTLAKNTEMASNLTNHIIITRVSDNSNFPSTTLQNIFSSIDYSLQHMDSTDTLNKLDVQAISNSGNERFIEMKSDTTSGTTNSLNSFLYPDLVSKSLSQNTYSFENVTKSQDQSGFNNIVTPSQIDLAVTHDTNQKKVGLDDKIEKNAETIINATNYTNTNRVSENSSLTSNTVNNVNSNHYSSQIMDSTDTLLAVTHKSMVNLTKTERSFKKKSKMTSGTTVPVKLKDHSDFISKSFPQNTNLFESTFNYHNHFNKSVLSNKLMPYQKYVRVIKEKHKKASIEGKMHKEAETSNNLTIYINSNHVSDNSIFASTTLPNLYSSIHYSSQNNDSTGTLNRLEVPTISKFSGNERSIETEHFMTPRITDSLGPILHTDLVSKLPTQYTHLFVNSSDYQEHVNNSVLIYTVMPSQRQSAVTKEIEQKRAETEGENNKKSDTATLATSYINSYLDKDNGSLASTKSQIFNSTNHYSIKNKDSLSKLTKFFFSKIKGNKRLLTTTLTTESPKPSLYSKWVSTVPSNTYYVTNTNDNHNEHDNLVFGVGDYKKQKRIDTPGLIKNNDNTMSTKTINDYTNRFGDGQNLDLIIFKKLFTSSDKFNRSFKNTLPSFTEKDRTNKTLFSSKIATTDSLKTIYTINSVLTSLSRNKISIKNRSNSEQTVNVTISTTTSIPTHDKSLRKNNYEQNLEMNAKIIRDNIKTKASGDYYNNTLNISNKYNSKPIPSINLHLPTHYTINNVTATTTMNLLTKESLLRFDINKMSVKTFSPKLFLTKSLKPRHHLNLVYYPSTTTEIPKEQTITINKGSKYINIPNNNTAMNANHSDKNTFLMNFKKSPLLVQTRQNEDNSRREYKWINNNLLGSELENTKYSKINNVNKAFINQKDINKPTTSTTDHINNNNSRPALNIKLPNYTPKVDIKNIKQVFHSSSTPTLNLIRKRYESIKKPYISPREISNIKSPNTNSHIQRIGVNLNNQSTLILNDTVKRNFVNNKTIAYILSTSIVLSKNDVDNITESKKSKINKMPIQSNNSHSTYVTSPMFDKTNDILYKLVLNDTDGIYVKSETKTSKNQNNFSLYTTDKKIVEHSTEHTFRNTYSYITNSYIRNSTNRIKNDGNTSGNTKTWENVEIENKRPCNITFITCIHINNHNFNGENIIQENLINHALEPPHFNNSLMLLRDKHSSSVSLKLDLMSNNLGTVLKQKHTPEIKSILIVHYEDKNVNRVGNRTANNLRKNLRHTLNYAYSNITTSTTEAITRNMKPVSTINLRHVNRHETSHEQTSQKSFIRITKPVKNVNEEVLKNPDNSHQVTKPVQIHNLQPSNTVGVTDKVNINFQTIKFAHDYDSNLNRTDIQQSTLNLISRKSFVKVTSELYKLPNTSPLTKSKTKESRILYNIFNYTYKQSLVTRPYVKNLTSKFTQLRTQTTQRYQITQNPSTRSKSKSERKSRLIKYNTYEPTERDITPPTNSFMKQNIPSVVRRTNIYNNLQKYVNYYHRATVHVTDKTTITTRQYISKLSNDNKNTRRTTYPPKNMSNKDIKTKPKLKPLLDPFEKTKLYPIKMLPSYQQKKTMKRIRIGEKNREVIAMNTHDFFSQKRFATRTKEIKDVLSRRRPPLQKMFHVSPERRQYSLSKFEDSVNSKKYFRPKPLFINNDDFYREAFPGHHKSGFSSRDKVNFVRENIMPPVTEEPETTSTIERPEYQKRLPNLNKPKFLRDRVDSIRNYLNMELKPTRSPGKNYFMGYTSDDSNDLQSQEATEFYFNNGGWVDVDTTTMTTTVTEWWLDDMYLKVRLPLPINSNPGMVFPKRHFAKMDEVADLGALFVDDLLDYKEMLDRGELPLERATSREKGQPLCMEQFYRLLGVCRIPEVGRDRLELPKMANDSGEGEELIIVACRNYLYPIPVKAADRGRLTPGEIQAQLLHAMVDAAGAPPAPRIGLLTAMNRDHWARAREQLIKDELNRMNLELISRALCVLCLDEAGGDRGDLDADTNGMLRAMHGAGTAHHTANRWFDKTVQLIISSDGTVGMCYEHSAAEGVAVIRLAERALARAAVADRPAPPPALLPAPQAMRWNITPDVHRTIERAANDIDRQISDLDFKVFTYRGYGREFMKSCRTSPDVYIQLALQYTYYKMYGYLVSTYESASLRRFRNGRVDNIRSAHNAARAWAAAMCTAETPPLADDDGQKKVSFNLYGEQRKLELFEEAARKQTAVMEANILGRGIDNHLLGLREAAREATGDLPPLFTDITYRRMIEFKLSTSQVATTSDGTFMGYGAVVPDGYGCSYNPKKDCVIFCIGSFHSSSVTSTEAFRLSLQEALDSMRLMFHSRKTEAPSAPR